MGKGGKEGRSTRLMKEGRKGEYKGKERKKGRVEGMKEERKGSENEVGKGRRETRWRKAGKVGNGGKRGGGGREERQSCMLIDRGSHRQTDQ